MYGFIDRDGREVIPCRLKWAFSFSDGLALVKLGGSSDGRYGYIDSSGQLVIPCQYTEAHPFSDGRAVVGQGGQENGLVRWLEGGLRMSQESTVADGTVPERFAVLVIQPSTREEYTIDGFPTQEAAIEFARRYTRDSLEESRQPGMTDRELREAWHLFGESACVIGGGYLGSQEIDFFIAHPATAEERYWQAIQPVSLCL